MPRLFWSIINRMEKTNWNNFLHSNKINFLFIIFLWLKKIIRILYNNFHSEKKIQSNLIAKKSLLVKCFNGYDINVLCRWEVQIIYTEKVYKHREYINDLKVNFQWLHHGQKKILLWFYWLLPVWMDIRILYEFCYFNV